MFGKYSPTPIVTVKIIFPAILLRIASKTPSSCAYILFCSYFSGETMNTARSALLVALRAREDREHLAYRHVEDAARRLLELGVFFEVESP